MPDDFYKMFESTGHIVMIQGVEVAKVWVAQQKQPPQEILSAKRDKEMLSKSSVSI